MDNLSQRSQKLEKSFFAITEKNIALMDQGRNSVELCIPSKFGFEKIVAECAVFIAGGMNFQPSKIEDLKTAVTEACLNAIEHGNKMDHNLPMHIIITPTKKALVVEIMDNGTGILDDSYEPDVEKKIEGRDKTRGWGLFLIKNLMDEVEIRSVPEKGNVLKIVLYLKSSSDGSIEGE